MNTWKEECVFVLENLGGHAYLKDIYEKFLKIHTRPVTENYRASIRDTLEKGSSESEKFDGTSLFYISGINNPFTCLNWERHFAPPLSKNFSTFFENKKSRLF